VQARFLGQAFLDRTEGHAGTGPADPGTFEEMIMSKTTAVKPAAKKAPKPQISWDSARLVCPDERTAEKVAAAFGLTIPDYEDIRKIHEEMLRKAWLSFDEALNETATNMHFQRITGTFVASAQRAGDFYTENVTKARDLTSKLANEDRDEDREPVYGFSSRAERAREFTAQLCMQAYALLAAAEGAVAAYKEITGKEWIPYSAANERPNNVERKAATAQMAAFG